MFSNPSGRNQFFIVPVPAINPPSIALPFASVIGLQIHHPSDVGLVTLFPALTSVIGGDPSTCMTVKSISTVPSCLANILLFVCALATSALEILHANNPAVNKANHNVFLIFIVMALSCLSFHCIASSSFLIQKSAFEGSSLHSIISSMIPFYNKGDLLRLNKGDAYERKTI